MLNAQPQTTPPRHLTSPRPTAPTGRAAPLGRPTSKDHAVGSTPSIHPNSDGVRVALATEPTGKTLYPGGSMVVGSDPACDLVVRDSGVSPRHLRLKHRGSAIELLNYADNAVRFAGAAVLQALLPLDGCFEVGPVRVTMRQLGGADEQALPGMIGTSPAQLAMARVVRRASQFDVPILLRGESGSGKELVARALHTLSTRREGPFVAINAATLGEELAPSSLFGHVKGAYTGAMDERKGALRSADGGTLFMDEVGAMPLPTQALLLRALEDYLVRPVGGDTSHRVNVRLVTATCDELEQAVRRGTFRRDLYQRIATCVVRVPPLRDRPEDVEPLALQALRTVAPGLRLAQNATAALRSYSFPGNVRELKNIILQAALDADEGVIRARHIKGVLRCRNEEGDRDQALTDSMLLACLERCKGNFSRAARIAGVARSTFRDRVLRARAAQLASVPALALEDDGSAPRRERHTAERTASEGADDASSLGVLSDDGHRHDHPR